MENKINLLNLEELLKSDIETLINAIKKEAENNSDTELGKAFYALSCIREKVNSVKTDYFGALKHLKMFEAISAKLTEQNNRYNPILAKNTGIIENLMFRSMKTENPVYNKIKKLEEKFNLSSKPEQLEIVFGNDKYSFEHIGLKREFLSKDGKNQYEIEVGIL
jgi:hypothetical protein